MMTSVTTVHLNPVSAEREEEFNLWYSYVHLRDVMGMPGHISAQRFCRCAYQPAVSDDTYKYYTFYELKSKAESTKSHQDRVMTWELLISSAFDFSNYKESYWDLCASTAPYPAFAEHGRTSWNLVALIQGKEGTDVEAMLSEERLNHLAAMDGVYAANLYRFGTEQMPKKTAAPEPCTHQLVVQLEDARLGCAAWDAFLAEYPELNGLEMAVTNYESMMPRLTEQWPTPQDRAISAIAHILAGLPGFCAGEAYVKKTDVLSPALRENLKRLAAEDAAGGN